MLVSRTTVRQLRAGEAPPDPLSGLPVDDRSSLLEGLANDARAKALPLSGGLPVDEERKINGRPSPLSQQARTGRSSLLGDR